MPVVIVNKNVKIKLSAINFEDFEWIYSDHSSTGCQQALSIQIPDWFAQAVF
jgi:hypothetical protein